jgi:urease accessory protein UreE
VTGRRVLVRRGQVSAAIEAVASAARDAGLSRCRVRTPDGLEVDVELGPGARLSPVDAGSVLQQDEAAQARAASRAHERRMYGASRVLRPVVSVPEEPSS